MDLLGLIPHFGNLALTIAAFVVALTIIVFVHEYGHYIVGRWSGIRADVFSIGIGPALWSRTDRRGTRWQIAALPLGGYVKFHGDANPASAGAADEALAGMAPEERRQTLPGAPLWARIATVSAGPVFNFIFSIAVFAAFAAWQGAATEPLTIAKVAQIPGYEETLRPGDEVLAIEGLPADTMAAFYDTLEQLPETSPLTYTIRRDGREMQVRAPHPMPPLAGSISPGSAADAAGLQPGDVFLAVDGQPVATFEQMRQIVGQSEGRALRFTVWRDGRTFEASVTPRKVDLPRPDGSFETRWLVGIVNGYLFEPQTRPLGPIEALGVGVGQVSYIITASISGLYHMIVGDISTCNLSGPIGIAQTSGQAAAQGVDSFIWFVAMLSTAVGFLNLFPIPVLDGGHLVFYLYEAVTGRAPSDRVLNILMTIGLAVVLSLMVFGLTNDLRCP